VPIGEKVIANKVKLGAKEALAMAREADDRWVARGAKRVHLHPRADRPTDEELLALLLGPSGTLRAPVVRAGRALLVGFHPDAYRAVFQPR
jgi:arsenate reductase-like glutaredoxin family protein